MMLINLKDFIFLVTCKSFTTSLFKPREQNIKEPWKK